MSERLKALYDKRNELASEVALLAGALLADRTAGELDTTMNYLVRAQAELARLIIQIGQQEHMEAHDDDHYVPPGEIQPIA